MNKVIKFVTDIKNRQTVFIFCGLAISSVVIILLVGGKKPPADKQEKLEPRKVFVKNIATPLSAVKPEDRWTNRIEDKVQEVTNANERLRQENEQMRQEVSALNQSMMKITADKLTHKNGSQKSLNNPQKNRHLPFNAGTTLTIEKGSKESDMVPEIDPDDIKSAPLSAPRIYQSSINVMASDPIKHIDTYIPAGTHAKGVIVSGLTAYTGPNSSADPEPIYVRLLDYGVVAKGFKGDIKDAVLIGSCYGDLSSSRAKCRLHTLTLEESNGEVLETPVEGWIMGEDGRSGLMKSRSIDPAIPKVRNAFMAGLLSGMSSFLQNYSQQSLQPTSVLGQRGGLNPKDMLAASGASGVENALEKLVDYNIKRAEQMHPVLVIDAGRHIDVLFKKGFDLSASSLRKKNQMTPLVSHTNTSSSQPKMFKNPGIR